MKTSTLLMVIVLCCLTEAGCGFKTFKPGELSTTDSLMSECAVTKLSGMIDNRRTINLYYPSDKLVGSPAIVQIGTRVQIISLFSGIDSIEGWYIAAKAIVPEFGTKAYLFRIYYSIDHAPNKSDFQEFLDKGFAPCK